MSSDRASAAASAPLPRQFTFPEAEWSALARHWHPVASPCLAANPFRAALRDLGPACTRWAVVSNCGFKG